MDLVSRGECGSDRGRPIFLGLILLLVFVLVVVGTARGAFFLRDGNTVLGLRDDRGAGLLSEAGSAALVSAGIEVFDIEVARC